MTAQSLSLALRSSKFPHALLRTKTEWVPTVLRVGLGVVMFPHAAQKMFGWFGGYGFSGTVAYFCNVLHMPLVLAQLVIVAEFLAALGLIVGFMTRFWAVTIGGIMLGAVLMVHAPHGFFMNWFGNQGGEGFEYHLLVLSIAVAVAVAGGGNASVDRRLSTPIGNEE